MKKRLNIRLGEPPLWQKLCLMGLICFVCGIPAQMQAEEAQGIDQELIQDMTLSEKMEMKISLDYKDVDILNVIRSLVWTYDLNIVTNAGVKGRVNLTLKNVTIEKALDAIVSSNDLSYRIRDDIIYVRDDDEDDGADGEGQGLENFSHLCGRDELERHDADGEPGAQTRPVSGDGGRRALARGLGPGHDAEDAGRRHHGRAGHVQGVFQHPQYRRARDRPAGLQRDESLDRGIHDEIALEDAAEDRADDLGDLRVHEVEGDAATFSLERARAPWRLVQEPAAAAHHMARGPGLGILRLRCLRRGLSHGLAAGGLSGAPIPPRRRCIGADALGALELGAGRERGNGGDGAEANDEFRGVSHAGAFPPNAQTAAPTWPSAVTSQCVANLA